MTPQDGITFTVGICCVWPLIVHLVLSLGLPRLVNYFRTHDLKNIQWHHLSDMWRSDE